MKLNHRNKIRIFFSLFLLFSVYTVVVAVSDTEKPENLPPISYNARKGKLLFQDYNCISCHQIYGLGGYMGPDLTNCYREKGEIVIRHFLKHGSPKMPNYKLSENEIDELTEYLEYIDKTGVYPVTNYKLNWYGTVESLN
jgi:nitric oxide reductase subunit C